MTSQERDMLTDLADKIGKTPVPAHDAEADEFIRTNIGKRPDALYILTQTTLIQNLAIQHAQQEIQELKQRLAQPAAVQSAPSFLGNVPTSRPANVTPSYVPAAPAAPAPPPPIPQNAPSAPEAPSFLRSAAQTAAGVAAGALAFEGIRSLFGGGGFGGFGGSHLGSFGGGSFLAGAPGGETIINNYYDTPEHSDRDDTEASAASSDADTSDDNTSDDNTSDDNLADSGDNSSDNYSDDTSFDDGGGSGDDNFA